MLRPKTLIPTVLVGVMGNSVIYLIPLLVGAMVSDRGFSEQQAGLIASADLAGYALATFVTALALRRLNCRTAAVAALAVLVVANVVATLVSDPAMFAAVRFVSGAGGGVLAAIATVTLGHSDNPDRNYGVLFAASLIFGTLGLWGLPLLLQRAGLNGGYFLIAGLALLAFTVVRRLPEDFAPRATGSQQNGMSHWLMAGAMLAAIVIFWAEQNALYAFLERIGNASGLSGQYIGFALGAANLTGFVGASLVAAIGNRLGRAIPLAVATILQLTCLWLLRGQLDSGSYLVAVGLISLAWNVVNPFQLGLLAAVDPSGRALALSATAIGAGLAAGPAMAAFTIDDRGHTGIIWLCAALAILSTLLMIPVLRSNSTVGKNQWEQKATRNVS